MAAAAEAGLTGRSHAMLDQAVAVLILVDVAPQARLWGYARFVIGRYAMRKQPGLRFFKILGSGYQGGFGLRPSASIQGLFCVFEDERSADAFLGVSPLAAAYRQRANELFSVKLRPFASRGSWAGLQLPVNAAAPQTGPVAILTRASIRPFSAKSFWSKAPAAQADLQSASGCLLAAGLGEAPLLRQATFSVWEHVASVDRYARSGAHLAAIKAAHQFGYFSESMFVRFVPSDMQGTWKGRSFG